MSLNDYLKSNYLGQTDVPELPGVVLTIHSFDEQEMRDGTYKPCIHFEEKEYQPLLLNKTNLKRLIKIFGTDDEKKMKGEKITVYTDPDIEFGGDIVGGVRIRKVSEATDEELNDDIPF